MYFVENREIGFVHMFLKDIVSAEYIWIAWFLFGYHFH